MRSGLASALVRRRSRRVGMRLRRAVIDGDVEHGSVMSGQSVGMVTKEEPVADIIGQLMTEAAHALEKRQS